LMMKGLLLSDDLQQTERRGAVVFVASAPNSIEMAAEMLHDGGLVALPTDTVYGVAVSWKRVDALDRLFTVKHRDRDKPIAVLVSSLDAMMRSGLVIDPDVALLLDQFWPGALTVAIKAPVGAPKALVAADGTIGVRMPNHRLALEVIEKAGGIVACSSANISGNDPATSAADVMATLGEFLDGVLDGGRAYGGVPSTVIGFNQGEIVVHRVGAIPVADLEAAWNEVRA
jgi:L-threonylcarbamoyladenylate synthase